jgi:hypothetical protein
MLRSKRPLDNRSSVSLCIICFALSEFWLSMESVDQNVEDKLFRTNAEQIMAALPDPYPSAEVIATDKDNIRRLQEALLALPPRTRAAFEMHRIEDVRCREVAAALEFRSSSARPGDGGAAALQEKAPWK